MPGPGSYYRPFRPHEVDWGVAYSKNEFGIDLFPLGLQMMANGIREKMAREGRTFDELHRSEIEDEFTPWLRQTRERKDNAGFERTLAECNAYIGTVAKMFNNRKNIRKPGFTPDRRVGKRKIKDTIEVQNNQLGWRFAEERQHS